MEKFLPSDALWYLIATLVLVALALINLQHPFVADQAVAIAGAKAIERGDLLYVDFWDNKMPGLFWFYWVAGKLFSFDEKGVHLFELIWMLVFSVAIAVGIRRYLAFPWLSSIAPLAVVGVYYATAGANHLTLPEIVVCFPLFVCALFSMRAGQSPHRAQKYFFISGIFAGISVVFKLVFAPICVAIWFVSFGFLIYRHQRSFGWLIKLGFLPVATGVVLILGLVVIKFSVDGALTELLWTAFRYPTEALTTSPFAGVRRLAISIMFIVSKYAVWMVPIAACLYWWLRYEKDIFTTTMLVWLVVGLAVILAQKFSWWGYHFFLIYPPLGLLGIKGLEVLIGLVLNSDHSPRLISALVAAPFLLSLVTITNEKAELALAYLVFEEQTIEDYRSHIRQDYALAKTSTDFLSKKGTLPGDIVVFGNPLIYHLSNRHPAVPMIGWPWEFFLQSQWLALPAQIEAAAPPYIFIADREMKIMDRRKGGVKEFIFERYIALHRTEDGVWLQLKRKYLQSDALIPENT